LLVLLAKYVTCQWHVSGYARRDPINKTADIDKVYQTSFTQSSHTFQSKYQVCLSG